MIGGLLDEGIKDSWPDKGAHGTGPDEYCIPGVDLNEEAQLRLLEELVRYYPPPFPEMKTEGSRYYYENDLFSYHDAITLSCMMRHLRPARVVEIGCGFSSAAMLDTDERCLDNSTKFTFIDLDTGRLESLIREEDKARVEILRNGAQEVDAEVFRRLGADDILFLDSSHNIGAGGDVNRIFFDILPMLRQGVYVCFHDIFSDFEYPTEWTWGFDESYLLRAFLQYNDAFEIALFVSFLARKHAALMGELMPLGMRVPGACIWIRKRR